MSRLVMKKEETMGGEYAEITLFIGENQKGEKGERISRPFLNLNEGKMQFFLLVKLLILLGYKFEEEEIDDEETFFSYKFEK